MSEDHTAEREAFEAWYSAEDQETDDPERAYELTEEGMNELTKYCVWQGWQARAAAPSQPDTHPTTGEPMGTDAQEATAWKLAKENLERENAALRDALQGAVSMAKDAHGHWDEDRDAKVGKHLLALAGANKGYDKRADAIHAALAGTAPASKEKEYAALRIVRVTNNLGVADWVTVEDAKAFADATHALRTGGGK